MVKTTYNISSVELLTTSIIRIWLGFYRSFDFNKWKQKSEFTPILGGVRVAQDFQDFQDLLYNSGTRAT